MEAPNFNVGTSRFIKVTDPEQLKDGQLYLRTGDNFAYQYISRYIERNPKPNNYYYFEDIYERRIRISDDEPYNPWEKTLEIPTYQRNKSDWQYVDFGPNKNNRRVNVYFLGPYGQMINENTSPDQVSEIIKARAPVDLLAVPGITPPKQRGYYPSWHPARLFVSRPQPELKQRPGLPQSVIDEEIKKFVAGKRRSKKRYSRRRKNTKRRKYKYKK